MMQGRYKRRIAWTTPLLFVAPLLMGADGGGCRSGGLIYIGSGGDGGSSEAGPDSGGICTPADCAGLGATLEAKLCPDGTSLGRTICTRESDGKCAWDFPACPVADAGVCQCSGPAPGAPSTQCADGSIGGPVCSVQANGTCAWQIRSCPPSTCPALGCFPQCPNGVLKDANGCDTCQCASVVCPTLACSPLPFCPNGPQKDAKGCDTCACAPSDGGSGGGPCKTDKDCPSGGVCGFPDADQCSAVGQCFPPPGPVCAAYSPGCACDGTEINVGCTGLPSGYESKPLLHKGACTDAGLPDAGRPCKSSADCGNAEECGFPEAVQCAAVGQCFPAPTVICQAYSPGCACDGTEISVVCTGLPSGYVSKPLRHTGACGIDGG